MSGWGLEAIHTWDADDAAFLMNDKDNWPMVKVRKIDGLRSLAEMDAVSDAKSGKLGEFPRASVRSGRTVVYSGSVMARSLAGLRELEANMLAAFNANSEKEMLIQPSPYYDTGSRKFSARAVDLQIPDEQTAPPTALSYGYERDFILTLRLSDPRLYDPTLVTDTSSSGSAALTQLVTNPRAGALATTGWTATSAVAFAAVALPFTDGLPNGINTGFLFWGDATSDRAMCQVAVTNATQYTASVYIAPQTMQSGVDVALQVRRADGTTVVGTSTTLDTVGGFTRLSVTFTAAATESYWIGVIQTTSGTSVVYFTGVQVVAGAAAVDYYDGDYPHASWSGTAHASTSSRAAYRSKVVTNAGNVETDPIIRLYGGAATKVAVRHKELDKFLAFGSASIATGGFVDIDFARRTIKANGVNPWHTNLDRALSDWWDEDVPALVPGANTIEFYRTGAGEVEIEHYDAYLA